jgi:hypothetical protein
MTTSDLYYHGHWFSQTLVDEARNTLGVSLSSSHLPLLFKLKYLGLYST